MTTQNNPAQNNPAPECAPFRFPVYPLFCAGDPNNGDMGATPEMVCPSVADTVKMWKLLLDPGHMVFNPAGLTAQQHIWHLIHGFATNHYSAAATATGIHLASQMLQLESLSYNKETAVKLYAQGCLISADTTDLENSNIPCIGWFTVAAGSSDIGFKLNPEYTKDVDATIPWTSLNRAALNRARPSALNFTLYEQVSSNESQGLPQSGSGLGSDPGPFKFTGIEHLFPVDRLDVPLVPRDQVTTIGIVISGGTGQINNWHFKQQGDRLNWSACPEHAPCKLHINFNDISQYFEETKIINCSFMRTSYEHNWFEEISTSKIPAASIIDATMTYEGCLFESVDLKPVTNSTGTKPNPKLALNFNDCGFTEASVDIRNCVMPGISLINCFGTHVSPNARHNSLRLDLNPDQVVTVAGATNKDDNIGDFPRRETFLSFWIGPDNMAGGAPKRDFGTDKGAAAEITLMDMPRQNPVGIIIDGPANIFMSNITMKSIRRCPDYDNHFVGVDVREPRGGVNFMELSSGLSKTSVDLSYSQGSTNIGVESLPAVLFDVLNIPAIDVDTPEDAAEFDLRYADKWGKAGAWERARTIGLLRANATEENIAQIERVIERLAPTGTRDSAKLVPTSSIGSKYKVKP